jgi:RNA polymerase sigma factor (sigma-70 family)
MPKQTPLSFSLSWFFVASGLIGSSEAFMSGATFSRRCSSIDNYSGNIGHFPSETLLQMSTVQVQKKKSLSGVSNTYDRSKKFIQPAIQITPPPRRTNTSNASSNISMNSNVNLRRLPLKPSRKSSSLLSSREMIQSSSPQDSNSIADSNSQSPSANRLTKEEESQLIQAVQALHHVILVRDNLSILKSPDAKLPYANEPSEEEWAEACNMTVMQLRKTLFSGRDARSRLVSGNIGLVLQIARKYEYELKKSVIVGGDSGIGTILTLSDLIQEGNLGLMEAAAKFDFKKGVRFGTYASYWIRQRILRAITDNSRVKSSFMYISLPFFNKLGKLDSRFLSYFYPSVHNHLRTIRKARAEMTKEIGREPSTPELAHRLEMPVEKLQLYNDSSRSVLSLEVPMSKNGISTKSGSGERDRRTLGDMIACDFPTPDEDAEFEALKKDIRDAIDALGNERERDVLLFRFGLVDGKVRTLEETGQRLGISRERVRVLENRALNKLRHPQRNYRLKEYVGNNQVSEEQDSPDAKFNFFGINDQGSISSPEKIWSF